MKYVINTTIALVYFVCFLAINTNAFGISVPGDEYRDETKAIKDEYQNAQSVYNSRKLEIESNYRNKLTEESKRFQEANSTYQKKLSELQSKYTREVNDASGTYRKELQEHLEKRRDAATQNRLKMNNESLKAFQQAQREAQLEFNQAKNNASRELQAATRTYHAEIFKEDKKDDVQKAYDEAQRNYQTQYAEIEAQFNERINEANAAYSKAQQVHQIRDQEIQAEYAEALQTSQREFDEKKAELKAEYDRAVITLREEHAEAQADYQLAQNELTAERQAQLDEALSEFQEAQQTYTQAMREIGEKMAVIAQRRAKTGELGIYLSSLKDGKVKIERVLPLSAAQKADLRSGDILQAIEGKKLPVNSNSGEGLRQALYELAQIAPGDEVQLSIDRDGEQLTKLVAASSSPVSFYGNIHSNLADVYSNLQNLPELLRQNIVVGNGRAVLSLDGLSWQNQKHHFNARLEMATLNKGLGSYFGTSAGVLVVNVAEDNIYQLKPGDVILDVGGRTVEEPRRLLYLLKTYAPNEEIKINIMRNKRKQQLKISVPAN